LKYWTRQPYFGFGVDAHSMLASASADDDAVRFAPADSLEKYMDGTALVRSVVSRRAAVEESFFLGLRLTKGISLRDVSVKFGGKVIAECSSTIAELVEGGFMEQQEDFLRLTSRGRLLSNEVFERFLFTDAIAG
jgi:oxygen-independent coproporphyrinogen III oxidase